MASDVPFIFPHDGKSPPGVRKLALGAWDPTKADLKSFTGVNNPQVSNYTVGDESTGFPVLFKGAQTLRQVINSMPSGDPSHHSELVHYGKMWGPGDKGWGSIALYFPSKAGWESRKGATAWHVLMQHHNVDNQSPSFALEHRGVDLGCLFSIRDGGSNSPYHAKELDTWHVWEWYVENVASGLGQIEIYYGKGGAKPTLLHKTSQKSIRYSGDYTYLQTGWYSYTSGFPLTIYRHLPILESCSTRAQLESLSGISGDVTPTPDDTTKPLISNLTALVSADSMSIDMSVLATDDVGVKSVVYNLDGITVATDTTAPYAQSVTLATPLDPGAHTVEAVAVDAAGNKATATYDFTISSIPPPDDSLDTLLNDLTSDLEAIKGRLGTVESWTALTDKQRADTIDARNRAEIARVRIMGYREV